MSNLIGRRTLLRLAPALGVFPGLSWRSAEAFALPSEAFALPSEAYALPSDGARRLQPSDAAAAPVPTSFPVQDPAAVREIVSVSHGNVARVKELVAMRPALARAAWEWGYGDWETALGAASHVGNREIAELLLQNGAQPTMFSAAMLGQLDVVKAFVAASPGAQRIRGAHGITLLSHARAGGAGAAEVVKYLEALGDADRSYTNTGLAEQELAALAGTYAFGAGAGERLVVATTTRGGLSIKRDGYSERGLFHQGSRVFNPPGAEAVRVRFEPASGRSTGLVVEDGPLVVRAKRVE